MGRVGAPNAAKRRAGAGAGAPTRAFHIGLVGGSAPASWKGGEPPYIQRAGVAGEDCGARAAADTKATAAAAGGRAEMAAAYRGPVGPLGNTPRGVIQRTRETGGARGQRATADRTGADKDGRKRGRDGGGDDMDQGGGRKRTRSGGGTIGGVKRKRGDG